ncbi:MAG TPA: hypothetical protein ENI63_01130 [Candidatus Kaiserbacteria bacterium]|nr:hypothetical protein [Candidatus Kaiserbacteria bacterium]
MDFTYLNIEYLFLLIYRFITGQGNVSIDSFLSSREFVLFLDGFKVVSTIVSLLLLTGIIYSYIRLSQIRKEESEELNEMTDASSGGEVVEIHRDKRWDEVLSYVNSDSPNDWRQAIIEADTILEDIVFRAGYPGETLGEKMRGIERSDFNTINEAWEAHKVRNRIAHDGSRFQLSKREALRIVDLYKKVFEEFYYI